MVILSGVQATKTACARPIQWRTALLPRFAARPVDGHVYLIEFGDFYKLRLGDGAERRSKHFSIVLCLLTRCTRNHLFNGKRLLGDE
jgi:phage-related protein